ncbi:MAG: WD40 repeat domain-containing protein, partial [Anaerolineae bacterium]|nr:WD40 repeat domain-containing protein [Anaerolineae bacterium]
LLYVTALGNDEFAHFTARCAVGDYVALETDIMWPIRTLQYISYTRAVLTGHTDDVHVLAISADGMLLASAGRDRVIHVWSLDTAEPEIVATLEGHASAVAALDFSDNGTYLASGGRDRVARIWTVETWELFQTLTEHKDGVTAVQFFPRVSSLFTGGGSFDTNVFLWDVTNGNVQNTFRGHTDAVTALAFSPDEQMLVTAGEDGTVIRWELYSHAPVAVLTPGGEIAAVEYHPDGAILATAGDDDVITFWDVALDIEVVTLECHTDAVTAIAFSADGALLASSSADGTLMLWDAATVLATLGADDGAAGDPVSVAPLAVLRGHTDDVNDVVFSPDGATLISASADGTVRLWDMIAVLANEDAQ